MNRDLCASCGHGGKLICCESCPKSYHTKCLKLSTVPDGTWHCPECTATGRGEFLIAPEFGGLDQTAVDLSPGGSSGEAVSFLQLLQQLELMIPHTTLAAVVAISRRFLRVVPLLRTKSPSGYSDLFPILSGDRMTTSTDARVRKQVWLPSASYSALFGTIATLIGAQKLRQACEVLHRRGPGIAFAFGTMAVIPCSIVSVSASPGTVSAASCPIPSQLCRICAQWRVLRSICLYCGASHRFANGGSLPFSGMDGKLVKKCMKRMKNVIESQHTTADPDAVVILKAAQTVGSKFDKSTPKVKDDSPDEAAARRVYNECSVSLRQRAVSRGYSYFFNMGKDKSLLDSSGGDMLFLLQKLWLMTQHKPAWHCAKAKRLTMKFARRWMKAHKHIRNRGIVKHLQDCLEGFHGLKQAMEMLKAGVGAISPPPQLLQKLARLKATAKSCASLLSSANKALATPAAASSTVTRDDGMKATPSNSVISLEDSSSGTVSSDSDGSGSDSSSDDGNDTRQLPVKSPKVGATIKKRRVEQGKTVNGSKGVHEKATVAALDDALDRSKRRKGLSSMMGDQAARANDEDAVLSDGEGEDGVTTLEVDGFDAESVKADLYAILTSGIDVNDIVGFDPLNGKLPVSPLDYCSHCGKEGNRVDICATCINCGCALGTKIDYGAMTDAMVWAFVFEDLGLPMMSIRGSSSQQVTMDDVILLLPGARAYKGVDELGHNFFKLQAYFMTHFIYVVSEWGKHQLPQELFWEEVCFIMSSMAHVISLDDPEIVGEFLHCLRILGVRESDPAFAATFQDGISYLLHAERKMGDSGLWVPKTASQYCRYHAAYTGIVGCLDFGTCEPVRTPKMFL